MQKGWDFGRTRWRYGQLTRFSPAPFLPAPRAPAPAPAPAAASNTRQYAHLTTSTARPPALYAVGTIANFSKELLRILIVDRDHLKSGWARLWAGYKDSRAILHDPDWAPMHPLD